MTCTKLLLHIGLHKTGTSAVQTFLSVNRDRLLEQDILYPLDDADGINHNYLAWHLLNPKYFPRHAEYYQQKASASHWEMLHKTIKRNLASKVILSGEDFCLLSEPKQLAALTEKYNIEILVYLRRQDQYLQSIYNEDVKNFEFMRQETFAEFIQNHRLDDIIHYDRFLLSWAQAFGKAKIKVAVYEPRYLKQQGLIADFCSRTGITLRDNMSLS